MTTAAAILAAGLLACQLNTKGSGSGEISSKPPPTKNRGLDFERTQLRPMDMEAASGRPERTVAPTYAENGQPAWGEAYETRTAGDRVRSLGSAEVRAARQEQAPDLEWGKASATTEPSPIQPQETFGKKEQKAQKAPPSQPHSKPKR
jgi:hypothetical protein